MMVPGILIVLLALGGTNANSDDSPEWQEVVYHGIRPTDPGGRDGLPNPERGLRIETLIAEAPGAAVWGPSYHLGGRVTGSYSDDWWVLDAQRYAAHGLTLAQTYCYLDDFVDDPISDGKLERLERSLNRLRQCGLKALLRFAYEKDMKRTAGPSLDTILGHMNQLEPIIKENADVIYVLQAGFVGAWGEWHSSTREIEKDHTQLAAIVARVLELLPSDRMTQVRVPKYKRWVLNEPVLTPFQLVDATTAFSGIPAARIGFHDDGFLAETTDGGTWPEPPNFANPGNPEYDYMTQESPYLPVDGELFWSDQGGVVDGLRAAVRMRLHHYSSFSLAHSYSEREGKPYSIDRWMETPMTTDDARGAGLPVSDGYFEDRAGNPVPRTQFEYIRDHLGYRFELRHARLPKTLHHGESIAIEIEIINRGFSAMHNSRPVYLVFVNADGEVVLTHNSDADPRRWQPTDGASDADAVLKNHFAAEIRDTEALVPGSYVVGLWLPDGSGRLEPDPRYAVRVANRDVPWWSNSAGEYGINLLGSFDVVPRSD